MNYVVRKSLLFRTAVPRTAVQQDTYCSYEGEWSGGLKQGEGVFTYGNGDVFKGVYDNNVRHGDGFLAKKDGEKRTEVWKLGKLTSFALVEERKKSTA